MADLTPEELRHRHSARKAPEGPGVPAMDKVALALGVPFIPQVRTRGDYRERDAAYQANQKPRRKRPVKP